MKFSEILQARLNRPENKGDEFGYTNQADQNSKRVINKNGSFNLVRIGEKKSLYHSLVTMPWWQFMLAIAGTYVVVNMLFAAVYLLIDFHGIGMTSDYEVTNRFLIASFFSVQTLTTVGYGSLYPLSATVSLIASIEALTGLMIFAIFTGLMYGRFSKPYHGIRFSRNMIYTPFRQQNALMFRVANERNHNLTELEARILMSVIVTDNGRSTRKYQVLELENSRITYFPLNWTLVHYIDEKSPLYGMTKTDFEGTDLEMMIMIKGYNETAAQSFHAKSSYTVNEIIWNAKFKVPYHFREDGVTVFELDKIDDYEVLS
ncbi:MAG TPA: ion channel [Saprospiraceae bacterium]|nr:ion channel [Saprospiraceae bacterium]